MSRLMKRTLVSLFVLLFFAVASTLTLMIAHADEYYTVRIDYVFENGTIAHDPYVAVYPTGADIDVTVTNPALPGYRPVRSLEESAATELTTDLRYDALYDHHTITVYYVPDLVHYRVHYYKQNIRDDLYTEDLTLDNSYYNRTGYTGEFPRELEELKFEGFTTLFHEPDFIAADGSTEFKIYYDRNYYLINFELGEDGYGVEPVYGKYGATFTVPEPMRKGYGFSRKRTAAMTSTPAIK